MDLTIIIIVLVITLVSLGVSFYLFKKNKEDRNREALSSLQSQLDGIRNESYKLIKEVTEEITKFGEGQKQVKDVVEELSSLQDILRNPKQRGVLGEFYLENIIGNVLPPSSFKMQYSFKNGETVDAVILIKDRVIPIDSKFSLENYARLAEAETEEERKRLESAFRSDLKNRIDETSKYIRPDEGTVDFAFMFIPAEAIYHDLLVYKVGSINARDMIEYAFIEKKVIIVSPTTLVAYLQTVLHGLKTLQIEESSHKMIKKVEKLRRHIMNYETFMKKLGNHFKAAVGAYNDAYRELYKIDKDIYQITDEVAEVKPMTLEEPQDENEI